MSGLSLFRGMVENRFPRLAVVYRRARDSWKATRKSTITPLGFRFVGPANMEAGTFESAEVALVERLLASVDTVVNIGANAGYYCCIAAKRGKKIIAFEPLAENVQLLLRNVRENGWADLSEIYPVGLGDRPNILNLFGGGTGASLVEGWAGSSAAQARLIPVSTADLILGDRLAHTRCMVIMDIEGAEYSALQGCQMLLAQRPRPIWMVEIHSTENQPAGTGRNQDFERTFRLFWDLGYVAWTATEKPRRIDPSEVASGPHASALTGTHNFLFVDPSVLPAALAGHE